MIVFTSEMISFRGFTENIYHCVSKEAHFKEWSTFQREALFLYFWILLVCFIGMLQIEPGALHMVSTCYSTELPPCPRLCV